MPDRKVLILGGTAEATALAEAAARLPGLVFVSSLAGRTRLPRLPAGEVRTGGFGGAEGLAAFLRVEDVAAVIDATHPFAVRISAHTREACAAAGIPRLVLVRPAWKAGTGDRWTYAADAAEAAARLPALGRRAFLTVGRGALGPFAAVRDVWFLVRLMEVTETPPLPGCEVVVGRPPFAAEAEEALMHRYRIDVLVAKESGGALPGKIVAARTFGLPVLLIRRPPPEEGETAETVAEALTWLGRALIPSA